LLVFEGEGEFFPFGEESSALGAEDLQFCGVFWGLLGGGFVVTKIFQFLKIYFLRFVGEG
jgi:hypothetical protein